MSVPADMMARLQQQQRGAPMPGGAQPGPAAAPMATPQPKDGKSEQARMHVGIALNFLEQALGIFGAETKDGQPVLKALNTLSRHFGHQDTSDLVPAQMKEMFHSMPQMGGGNEQQQMIAKMRAGAGSQPAQMPKPPAPMPSPM